MISAELMTSRLSTNQIIAWIGLEVDILWVCTQDFSMELLSWTHRIYTLFRQMLLADYLSYIIYHDSDLVCRQHTRVNFYLEVRWAHRWTDTWAFLAFPVTPDCLTHLLCVCCLGSCGGAWAKTGGMDLLPDVGTKYQRIWISHNFQAQNFIQNSGILWKWEGQARLLFTGLAPGVATGPTSRVVDTAIPKNDSCR